MWILYALMVGFGILVASAVSSKTHPNRTNRSWAVIGILTAIWLVAAMQSETVGLHFYRFKEVVWYERLMLEPLLGILWLLLGVNPLFLILSGVVLWMMLYADASSSPG